MYPVPNEQTDKAFRNRIARANDLLNGTVDISAYPHRYLLVGESTLAGGRAAVLTAVEWLEQNGWEVVSAYWDNATEFSVLIRRVQTQPQTRPQDA